MCTRQSPAPDSGPQSRGVVLGRREVLAGLPLVGLTAVLAACSGTAPKASLDPEGKNVALVYRGAASCEGCSEALGDILSSRPFSFRVVYCGPEEPVSISAENLAKATVYVQPGGGNDLRLAWSQMRPFAADITHWVRNGGNYLGICLGGYLAGFDPGFALLPGDSGEYITSPGATVHNIDDTSVMVSWRGVPRQLYFQDGPYFTLRAGADATVLATYSNGLTAALVARCGRGSVGVVGPHPEADASWYAEVGLPAPKESTIDLMRDLITTTLSESVR